MKNEDEYVKRIVKNAVESLLKDDEKMKQLSIMMKVSAKLDEEELKAVTDMMKIAEQNGRFMRDMEYLDEIREGSSKTMEELWCKVTGNAEFPEIDEGDEDE